MTQEFDDQIDPEILAGLGLEGNLEAFDAKKKKEQLLLSRMEEEGQDFYNDPYNTDRIMHESNYLMRVAKQIEFKYSMNPQPIPILTWPRLSFKKHELPTIIMRSWSFKLEEEQKQASLSLGTTDEKIQTHTKVVEAFIFGYGVGALNNLDAQSAVSAFSQISPEGILSNEKVLKTLKTYSEQDKTFGVSLAREIQKKQSSQQSTQE